MTEIKLYKTKGKAIILILISALFVAAGIGMIVHPDSHLDEFMGWISVCFFGLGILAGLFHFFDFRPQIIITENGIWDRTTKQDEIKWEQIKKAYLINIYRQKFISLATDKTFVFKKKQYKWAQKLTLAVGAQKLNISLGQIKIDEKKLLAFIKEMIRSNQDNRKDIIQKYLEANLFMP